MSKTSTYPVIKVNKRRETDPDKLKPTGVVLNRKDLRNFKQYSNTFQDAESLYLRENEFVEFDPYIDLVRLKILDLSMNMITGTIKFLPKTPVLRHLYLTSNKIESLSGICGLQNLESLCLSDNLIKSFEGLDALPNLRLLSLNYNQIVSFYLYPHLPSLHTLNLVGNPIVQIPSYRNMAIALSTNNLVSIDGKQVESDERAAVEHYKGKIVFCMAEGFVVEGDNVEEAADTFLLNFQRDINKDKPLRLLSVGMSSKDPECNLLTEGVPVKFGICMQDLRDYATRSSDIFFSSYLFPVVFRMSGEASEAFVIGSMNHWTDPIPMERCDVEGEIFHQTTLYLPAGEYEYRYIVDGEQKVSEENKTVSQYRQGECNIHSVAEPEQQDDNDSETILYIRWMRSDANNGFTVIENENRLSYTPTSDDIGFCLRAEVLAYEKGDYSFQYFDISTPISAGPPTCTKLEIVGNASEGETLTVNAAYSGGQEGNSSLAWFRVSPDGDEVPIECEDPWVGYVIGLEDIGHRIKVEFTPVRDDWVAGTPVTEMSAIVSAGIPTCRDIKIIGDPAENKPLNVQVLYTGGIEGESTYQWFRHDDESGEFFPILDATSKDYVPRLQDVGKMVAVEYTPISKDGIEGERCRCVLDKVVTAALPELRSIAIKGELEEQHVLFVEVEYFGGYFGNHIIQWYRREGKDSIKIGRSNVASCTLTSKEVGRVIEVVFTPVRSDGAHGKPYAAQTNGPVRAGLPQLKTMEVTGEPAQGNVLVVVADYFGGEQGESIIEWSRAAPDTREFELVANKTKKYVIQQEDVGRMLRVTYTPVRSDGIMGEPKQRLIQVPAPKEPEQPKIIIPEPKPDVKPEPQPQPEVKPEPQPEVKPEPEPEQESESQTKQEIKSEPAMVTESIKKSEQENNQITGQENNQITGQEEKPTEPEIKTVHEPAKTEQITEVPAEAEKIEPQTEKEKEHHVDPKAEEENDFV